MQKHQLDANFCRSRNGRNRQLRRLRLRSSHSGYAFGRAECPNRVRSLFYHSSHAHDITNKL